MIENKYNGFTQIPNIIFSIDLSHGAFKLCCYMYSRPKDWQYYNKAVSKELAISERSLASYWKELIENNIIHRERKVVDNFVNGGFVYSLLINAKNIGNEEGNFCGDVNTEKVDSKKTKISHSYNDILETWNDYANIFGLSTIILINDDRKKVIDKLFKVYGKNTNDAIIEGLSIASLSKFLMGNSNISFKMSFDWFFKVSNITKILEGNYK
jgi:hypothetical protein